VSFPSSVANYNAVPRYLKVLLAIFDQPFGWALAYWSVLGLFCYLKRNSVLIFGSRTRKIEAFTSHNKHEMKTFTFNMHG